MKAGNKVPSTDNHKTEAFWDKKFREIDLQWGVEPAESSIYAMELFQSEGFRKVLIPGIGYGRNGSVFSKNGFDVTGIEISGNAIRMARESLGLSFTIHHGSVLDMPFDKEIYDGIYCYALLHLFNQRERMQLIRNCYNQLAHCGTMIFSVISKTSNLYGQGKLLSKNRFEVMKGLAVYFYDPDSAQREFRKFGFIEAFEMDEPVKFRENEQPMKMILVKCRKENSKSQSTL